MLYPRALLQHIVAGQPFSFCAVGISVRQTYEREGAQGSIYEHKCTFSAQLGAATDFAMRLLL